mgnify:CR=1 FL=1
MDTKYQENMSNILNETFYRYLLDEYNLDSKHDTSTSPILTSTERDEESPNSISSTVNPMFEREFIIEFMPKKP